ncbi:MAG: hypothetical protein LLG00_06715 [Planctomycetaceae bacterium]|nr:hypothetical protein [Planctomycetaceae bacterium]
MKIAIKEFGEEHVAAVRQFNCRLKAGGATLCFPESPIPEWLPKSPGRKVFQEHYLAIDEGGDVRGAYTLKHQEFWIKDRVVSIADFRLPISEGIINRRYASVAVQLLRDALARQPLLFGLGMGGYDEPVARLLQAAGWSMHTVPFFFRIIRPVHFLRNITYLRRSRAMHGVLDALALSGIGSLGVRTVQAFRRRVRPDLTVDVKEVKDFNGFADRLWETCHSQYGMTAVRNDETMQALYPEDDPRFTRLEVSDRGRPLGYAVLINTAHTGHKYFGDMRLGSIVSCFGHTDSTANVVSAAAEHLESQGVDLIVSNHSHVAWQQGFRRAGFLSWRSNVIFAASKALTEMLSRAGVTNEQLHFNRGDGDGPVNL